MMCDEPIVLTVAILHLRRLIVFVFCVFWYIGVVLFLAVSGCHLCHVIVPFSHTKLLNGSHTIFFRRKDAVKKQVYPKFRIVDT